MRWFARNAKRWGPRGVLLACAVSVALAAVFYFATPEALDQAGVGDGPGIPPELADHQERAGLERGMAFGASPATPLPRPDTLFQSYSFQQSPNWSGRNGCGIEAIVLHVTGPGSMAGMASWFKNPTSAVSAHFGIGKQGEVQQYVDLENAAWHAGIVNRPTNPLVLDWQARGVSPNRCTVGIELLLGGPAEPLVDYPKMQASLDILLRWLIDTLKVSVDRTHIMGHYEIDGVNRSTDPRCCVDLDSIVKALGTSGAASSVLGCTEYPCLTSSGVYRMADGWTWEPKTGDWRDAQGVLTFTACNVDKLRWSPPIARWVTTSSSFYDPIRNVWAQAPAC